MTIRPIKSEPLSPVEAVLCHEGQTIKSEPEEGGNSEAKSDSDDLSMKPEHIYSKEAGESDKKPNELYPFSPSDSLDLRHQSMKPETKSFQGMEYFDDKGSTSSAVQTEFQRAHSSHMCQEDYFVYEKLEEGSHYKFKLTIPHYVEQEALVPLIQVKWGNIHEKLCEIRKGKPEEKFEPYCEVYNDHVIVYADHFCDVVCTCPDKVCTSKLLAFPFGQIRCRTWKVRDAYEGENLPV